MTEPSEGGAPWRGTYGVFAGVLTVVAGLLLYHRLRKGDDPHQEFSATLQEALYELPTQPGEAAKRLQGTFDRAPAASAPWLMHALAAAQAAQADRLQAQGKTQEAQAQRVNAVQTFQQAVQRFPDHPVAPLCQLAIGQAYENAAGNDFAATQAYKNLLERYPDSPASDFLRARVMDLLKRDPALFPKGSGDKPKDVLDVLEGTLRTSRRRYQEAMTEMQKKGTGDSEKKEPQ